MKFALCKVALFLLFAICLIASVDGNDFAMLWKWAVPSLGGSFHDNDDGE